MISITVRVKSNRSAKDEESWIEGIKKRIMIAAEKAVRETTNSFFSQVLHNITMPMHGGSPEQHYLALHYLGHPFSVQRYSTWQPHGHTPVWSVHTVYGTMQETLKKKVEVLSKRVLGTVGWFDGYPPEVWWILTGTSRMRERPVLQLTSDEMNLLNVLVANFYKAYNATQGEGWVRW